MVKGHLSGSTPKMVGFPAPTAWIAVPAEDEELLDLLGTAMLFTMTASLALSMEHCYDFMVHLQQNVCSHLVITGFLKILQERWQQRLTKGS